MRIKPKFLLKSFAGGVVSCFVLYTCFWLYGVLMFNAPPLDLKKLDLLRLGMSKAEVQAALGPPNSVESCDPSEEEPSEAESWIYSRAGSWPIVYVYFDRQGQFERHRYDD